MSHQLNSFVLNENLPAQQAAEFVLKEDQDFTNYLMAAESPAEVIQRIQEKSDTVNAFLNNHDRECPPGIQAALNVAAVGMYLRKRRQSSEDVSE